MPNHVKNSIELLGDKEKIKEMIEKFSTHYPRVLDKTYNDEQIICNDKKGGNNTRNMIIKAGKIVEDNSPENQSNAAYELFILLNPDCDYIKMIDGKYQYVEEDN